LSSALLHFEIKKPSVLSKNVKNKKTEKGITLSTLPGIHLLPGTLVNLSSIGHAKLKWWPGPLPLTGSSLWGAANKDVLYVVFDSGVIT
jgi:hypothetical protein